MIHAIAFDLDGTLLDHPGAQRAALAHLHASAEELRACESLDELAALWVAAEDHFYERFLAGELSFPEQRVRRVQHVLARWGQTISDDDAMFFFDRYRSRYEENWFPYDDVLPCLTSLTGYALGIITNGDGVQQRQKLERIGLTGFFASIVVSGDVGRAKPHPEIFARSASELGVAPHELLYVGDRLDVDAIGASQAGLRGVWLNRGAAAEVPAEVLTVTDLRDLLRVVEEE